MPWLLPLLSLAFSAGILLAGHTKLAIAEAALLTVLVAAPAAFVCRRKKTLTPLLVLSFLFLGFALACFAIRAVHAPLSPLLEKEVVISGYVHEVLFVDEKAAVFFLQVEKASLPEAEARRVKALVRVRVYNPPAAFVPVYGQRLELKGKLTAPSGPRIKGGFDYASYLQAAGAGAVLNAGGKDVSVLTGRGGNILLYGADKARSYVLQGLFEYLPASEAGLAAGLLLGKRELMAEETAAAYNTLGISHLLAVSGLHVGFVIAFALAVCRRFRFGGAMEAAMILTLVLGYILLTGGRAPVWRSALMFSFALAARGLNREQEGAQGLFLVLLGLLFWRPLWLFSLSFQFSFLATIGIIFLSPAVKQLLPMVLPRYLSEPIAMTAAAQAAVLPLQVLHFYSLPLLVIPANLFCLPLVALSMMLGMAGTLAGFVFSPLAAPFYLAALPALSLLDKAPQVLSRVPFAAFDVLPPFFFAWLLYLFLLMMLCHAGRQGAFGSRARLVLSLLLVLNLICWWGIDSAAARNRLEITVIDVGQGMSVFVRTAGGTTMLIDGGSASFDSGERVIKPFLRHSRVSRLDLIFLTHPHEDHYGGLAAVTATYPPRLFISNGEEGADSLKKLTQNDNLQIKAVMGGDLINLGETTIEVLSPPAQKFLYTSDDVNNNSLVLRITYHEFVFLVTGDAEEEALAFLVREKAELLPATVLQVPHHGSGCTGLEHFFSAVSPEVAVIPVGSNLFGHPSKDVLELLEIHKTETFRTDLHGSITITSDGYRWEAEPALLTEMVFFSYDRRKR